MNFNNIQEALVRGENAPRTLVEYKSYLSGHSSYLLGQLEEILGRRPLVWSDIRKHTKSDKSADREYDATIDGLDSMKLEIELKRIKLLISAINSSLRLAESEAKNLF